MVYGYVNRRNGETIDSLKGIEVDKIIYFDKYGFDFSFAEKDDLVVINSLTSVCDSLKGLLEFAQFIDETDIRILLSENKALDTRCALGKMLIGMWAYLNRFDDECFRNSTKDSGNA